MKKLVDILIPVSLGLFVGLLISVALAKAEPPNFDQYGYRNPPPQQQQRQETTVESLPGTIATMLVEEGLLGIVVLCLGYWFVRESKLNRIDRNEQLDKYVQLTTDISTHLASNTSKLDGLEREIEMLQTRKG
jgi:hypothetical protein